MSKGLVIIHVDGLGYDYMQKGLAQGRMPFVRKLIESEGYAALPYRCGLPSTTPFCQAGILYGDNDEIPSFRWWDKQAGLLVEFGGFSSFRHVAHKYFKDTDPLTHGGASIAACYPADAEDTFLLAYRQRDRSLPHSRHAPLDVLVSWATNPLNLLEWLTHGLFEILKTIVQVWQARLRGQRAAPRYVISDMLEEIFLHHLTRYAVIQAMERNYPVIYGGFYAYDETAHAFGPEGDYSLRILREIDDTIRRVAEKRTRRGRPRDDARQYELVVLSDHGQIETIPFQQQYGKHLGELLAQWLPSYDIEETKARRITPVEAIDGHILLTYSGGLAHLYFKDLSWRLHQSEIEARFAGLIEKLARTPGIEFVLLRAGTRDVIVTRAESFELDAGAALSDRAREFLARFDDPAILARQLHKLNSFERAGDLILFGEYANGRQVNFEDQVGGHGSIGGEQLHPFVLAKREWRFDTTNVTSASELYPLLKGLRDELLENKT